MDLVSLLTAASAVANLGQTGYNIWQLFNQPEPEPPRDFQRARGASGLAISTFITNPYFLGLAAPGDQPAAGVPNLPTWTIGAPPYEPRPFAGMRALYNAYLQRQYGLPQHVARAYTAQALSGLAARRPQLGANPNRVARALMPTADQIAQSALRLREPEILHRQDIIRGAAELAAFDLMRAQQAAGLI